MNESTFGDRINQLRNNLGISVAKFAALLGFDRSYIHRVESGEADNPSLKFIEAVVSKCGVDRHWLLGETVAPIKSRLEAIRAEKKLTWENLAKELAVSPSLIYQVLQGKRSLGDLPLRRLSEIEGARFTPALDAKRELILAEIARLEESVCRLKQLL